MSATSTQTYNRKRRERARAATTPRWQDDWTHVRVNEDAPDGEQHLYEHKETKTRTPAFNDPGPALKAAEQMQRAIETGQLAASQSSDEATETATHESVASGLVDERNNISVALPVGVKLTILPDEDDATATSPDLTATERSIDTVSTGAKQARAKQETLPTMTDRRVKELHDLAARYAEIKLGMRELKTEQDDLSGKIAQILHRQKRTHYRCDGLLITLEEVEKVKVTTGKTEDDAND
jgi:hypothetical protein